MLSGALEAEGKAFLKRNMLSGPETVEEGKSLLHVAAWTLLVSLAK